MNRERWRTVFFLVVLIVFSLFIRIFFLNQDAILTEFSAEYYQKAMIGKQGVYQIQAFTLDEIYTKFLSLSMLFFGNSEIAGVSLNIMLQVFTIICIYLAMTLIANVHVSILVSGVIFVIPFYWNKVYEISSFNLLMLMYAIGFFVLSVLCKGVSMFKLKKRTVEQEQIISSESQEEQTGVITLDDIIGNSDVSVKEEECKNEKLEQSNEREILPAGMREIIVDDEEKKKKVKYLENPLPLPKRREHKEMDFAVTLNHDDDFDIKDISGMDFYDIE